MIGQDSERTRSHPANRGVGVRNGMTTGAGLKKARADRVASVRGTYGAADLSRVDFGNTLSRS